MGFMDYSAPTTSVKSLMWAVLSVLLLATWWRSLTGARYTVAATTQQKGDDYPDDIMLCSTNKKLPTSCGFSTETVLC